MDEPAGPTPPPPERLPRRFGGRYVLLKEIGRGGLGSVYLAASGRPGAGRACALKVIHSLQGSDRNPEEMTQRFLDEAKVVTQLSHDNLVFVFDFGIVDRKGFLAMEVVGGKNLTEVWNRCARDRVGLPTGVAAFVVSELVAALGYAHRVGGLEFVHRDVSPSNLMIAYSGGLKLIDFGLAKWKEKLARTETGIVWGKVNYMSPEQNSGQPIDHRSDLYSAGIILWELFTGRQLFPNAESRAAAADVAPPSRFCPGLAPGLDEVVARALALRPADRFTSGEEMSTAILAAAPPGETSRLKVAEFMERLFGPDHRAETAEQAELLAQAAALASADPVAPAARNEEADPLVGTVLADRYYIRRRIGEGAMGSVYEGHHTGVGKRVAIKIPRAAAHRKSERLERIRREAQAASKIGHPNIADVTDCDTTPAGDFFFVMEFVDGVDLERLLRDEGPLPLERALVLAVQVCRALEAAHAAGIIHRDLKPSNVMRVRGDEDFVKVLDFGVAKFLRETAAGGAAPELTLADAAVGTPRYMAPEQIDAGHEVDFRADIYALGGLLYALLSGGKPPFEGEGVHDVWHRKLHGEPTPLRRLRPDVPAGLESVIMRCLARKAERRPVSMSALKKELVAALEALRAAGSQVNLRPTPAPIAIKPGPAAAPSSVRRAGALAVAALLAAVTGAVVWRALETRPSARANLAGAAPPPPTPAAAMTGAPTTQASGGPPATAESRADTLPAAPAATTAGAAPPARSGEKATAVPSAETARAGAGPRPRSGDEPRADSRGLLEAAETAYQRGRQVEALQLAQKALRAGGGAPAYVLLGKINVAIEQFEEAEDAFREALRLEPGNATARRGLEQCRARLGVPSGQ